MLNKKIISNNKEKVCVLTHASPPIFFHQIDYSSLAGQFKIISLINHGYPTPKEIAPFVTKQIFSNLGEFELSSIEELLSNQKQLYFAGGAFSACLANTIKSLYALPQKTNKNFSFTLLADYVWEPCYTCTDDSLKAYLAETKDLTHIKTIYTTPLDLNLYRVISSDRTNILEKFKTNLFFHYAGIKHIFYENPENNWNINLIVD
jgi:hypothetical protein